MVVTVTPNPSLDRTLEVDSLARGAVVRASVSRMEAAGKDVNVSRALQKNGRSTVAILPAGGHEGRHLAAMLGDLGLDVRVVPVARPIRENVSVVERGGGGTRRRDGPASDPGGPAVRGVRAGR